MPLLPGWELYDFVLRTSFLLNKLNFDLTLLTRRFESQRFKLFSNVLKILNFVNLHKENISYFEKGKFKIVELQQNFVLGYRDIDVLNSYFEAKEDGRICFFATKSNFFAKFQNLVFLIPFPHGIWELTDTFLGEDYAGFNVKDGVVIDVGAFIGETAIYFATKGAKKVIAFEPAPTLFRLAQQNVKINNLQNIIQMRNEAIWGTECEKKFRFATSQPGSSSIVILNKKRQYIEYEVKTTTLNQVIKEEGIIDLLKMDCEGAEYQILPFLQKDGDLRNITNIILEVHGPPQEILNILRASQFKITRQEAYHNGAFLVSASKNA